MLKSIDPILNADVLYALRAMGHGDDLAICDTNFPADAVARQTALGRLLRIDGVTASRTTFSRFRRRCRPRSTPLRDAPGRWAPSNALPSMISQRRPIA